jgi:hypothetical protein
MEKEAGLPVRSHEFVTRRKQVMKPGASRADENINIDVA